MPTWFSHVSIQEGQLFLRPARANALLLSLMTAPEMALFAGPSCGLEAESDGPSFFQLMREGFAWELH